MNQTPLTRQYDKFNDCMRPVMPKTILHIDGSTTFDLEKLRRSSHGNRSQSESHKKPGKGLYVQLSCRFTGEGVFHACHYGRSDLQDVVTDQRTKKELIDSEEYFTNGLRIAAEVENEGRELFESPDNTEPVRLIHLGDHQYKCWEYYLLHKKIKPINPHVGFVMCDNMPYDKKILIDGKLVSLGEHMESHPVLSQASISIQEKSHRLNLRACRIKFLDPRYKKAGFSVIPKHSIIEMTCVLACFVDDPSRKWFLTSNEGSTTATAQDALMIVELYAKRWQIEEYFELFKLIFPVKSYLKANYTHYVNETFVNAAMAYRASQLDDFLHNHPKQKITKLFTATELKCLFMLHPEHRNLSEEERKEKDHSLFLKLLDYNAKDTAILITKFGSLDNPEKCLEPNFEKMVIGYGLLHQFVEMRIEVSGQLGEHTKDSESSPQKLTLKLMLP